MKIDLPSIQSNLPAYYISYTGPPIKDEKTPLDKKLHKAKLWRAIKDMEEAKRSHQSWFDYMARGGKPKATFTLKPETEREWVRRYNRVLKILYELTEDK